ncbi:helix-turn-helix domain-containing protein [Halopiger xanaduensis]|uniref:Bacterio-opsin activator HTH domain protein n=1 Tax=Halopiger xanaduensis (strain DSM 18323 / JCM 14033 / SH-6) TaxID=797210 RepID=F8D3E8_HALXS|nr:helix-turn-helix domain-containing protein [Halopiger xanaduensis]AEH36174.1 Bacterio-opsin activator HTH domain protein [Halopiger xanaduensis SH-6]
MATLVEFTVDGDEFPLGALFASLPDVAIELDRIVPTTGSLCPYVWIRGASPAQLEALELAYERGYFDEPRRATLEDLAAGVGITRQSLAGRLRRGHRNLLAGLFGFDRPSEQLSAERH